MIRYIKRYINEVILHEAKVSASAEYIRKEAIRQELQSLIASKISSGEISDQSQLDEWVKTAVMALGALKMVPVEAYKSLNKVRK